LFDSSVLWGLSLPPTVRGGDVRYVIEPVAEIKVQQLPKDPLYWRVENFPTLDQAKSAASKYGWNPDTVSYDGWPSMPAEVAGKAWLFTRGQKGAAKALLADGSMRPFTKVTRRAPPAPAVALTD